jgi:hypothetical protein
MTIWSILWPLERFYGHLVNFVVIWYIFPPLGILDQEKSGNPVLHQICGKLVVASSWVISEEKYPRKKNRVIDGT